MMRHFSLGLMALAVLAPAAATAQMENHENMSAQSVHEEQIEDVKMLGDKFIQLANAFSEEQYDWEPMEDVRSVKDVMVLMIAEFYVFPTLWGTDVPEGVPGGFGGVIGQYADSSKDEIVADLETALAHMVASLEGLSHQDQMAETEWFGNATTNAGAIMRAAGDMHEHLGQAIAYARTNHVVPPWSAGN